MKAGKVTREWIMKTRWVEQARHKTPHVAQLRVFEMGRTNKSIETESRWLMAWGRSWVQVRVRESEGPGFPFEVTELSDYAEKWWTVYFKWVHFTVCHLYLIKLLCFLGFLLSTTCRLHRYMSAGLYWDRTGVRGPMTTIPVKDPQCALANGGTSPPSAALICAQAACP